MIGLRLEHGPELCFGSWTVIGGLRPWLADAVARPGSSGNLFSLGARGTPLRKEGNGGGDMARRRRRHEAKKETCTRISYLRLARLGRWRTFALEAAQCVCFVYFLLLACTLSTAVEFRRRFAARISGFTTGTAVVDAGALLTARNRAGSGGIGSGLRRAPRWKRFGWNAAALPDCIRSVRSLGRRWSRAIA